jgi:hypothetical protein
MGFDTGLTCEVCKKELDPTITKQNNDTLNLNSIEIIFNPNSEDFVVETFIHELLALTTKYQTIIPSLNFKENK